MRKYGQAGNAFQRRSTCCINASYSASPRSDSRNQTRVKYGSLMNPCYSTQCADRSSRGVTWLAAVSAWLSSARAMNALMDP